MRNTVNILDVNIDVLNMSQAIERISDFLKEDCVKTVFTPNSEIIMVAQKDNELKNILNNSDMLIADGIGVVWASRMVGKSIPERVTGFDTMTNLFKEGSDGSISFYLLGGKPGTVEKAHKELLKQYPNINVAGMHHGYFNADEEKEIIKEINDLCPDILLVALGAPKQEKWIYNNKANLCVKVCMGVGGCFDVIAGNVKRAPVVFQRLGLEWFYRLIKEPSRYKRMLKLPQFAITVMLNKFKRSETN